METIKKKKVNLKQLLSILFFLIMLVLTFTVIFGKYSFSDFIHIFSTLDKLYVMIAMALIFAYILFEGLATRKILQTLGYNTSIIDNSVYAAIDFYYCSVTPSATGGQPMVAYYMAKDDIPVTQSTIVLLLNTALFKITLLLFAFISVFFAYDYIFDSVLMLVLFIIGIVINVFLITLCLMCAFKKSIIEKSGKRIIMLLAKMKILKNPIKLIRTFVHKMNEYEKGAHHVRQHKIKFGLALLYNIVQRGCLFSVSYFIYLAFKSTYPELVGFSYFDLFAIQVLIAVAVDSLPFPGGMGISEVLYLLAFQIVYAGITVNGASLIPSAMIITRGINFYFPLIVTGIISLSKHLLIMFRTKKIKEI